MLCTMLSDTAKTSLLGMLSSFLKCIKLFNSPLAKVACLDNAPISSSLFLGRPSVIKITIARDSLRRFSSIS